MGGHQWCSDQKIDIHTKCQPNVPKVMQRLTWYTRTLAVGFPLIGDRRDLAIDCAGEG